MTYNHRIRTFGEAALIATLIVAAFCPRHLRAAPALRTSQVRTPDGVLEGVISADEKVRTFKGIPYAAPPIGPLRWKEPQGAKSWEGVRRASEYGARCMQAPIYSDMVFHDNGPSEDCLTLNLWMPAHPAIQSLPVMVWIYGGGFLAGSSSEPRQDAGNLSKKGVLVVSMNYRLGIFGYFAHPELAKESGRNSAGNYGLMDQLAALKWVHDNISLFGGDPKNVTIFGESAGSFSVSALMASPLAQGFFQHAIGESGAFFGDTLALKPLPESEKQSVSFAESELGTSSLQTLREKPAAELLDAQTRNKSAKFSPNIDGYFLPESVASIFSSGHQSHIPLLAGWNADEGSYRDVFKGKPATAADFVAWVRSRFGQNADAVLKLYPARTDKEAKRSAQDLVGDQRIGFSTWKWLEMQGRTAGDVPIYRYEFDQAPPSLPSETESRGAYHSAEIEYVFNVLTHNSRPWTGEDRTLSDVMAAYWSNFAKTGNPNGAGLPEWPEYKAKGRYEVMHLVGSEAKATPDQHRRRYKLLDKLPREQ